MLKRKTIENTLNEKIGAENMLSKNDVKIENKPAGVDNMNLNNFKTKNIDNMSLDGLKLELKTALNMKLKALETPLLNKRALSSYIKKLKRNIFLKVVTMDLSVDNMYNSFINAYKNKLITKGILEKNLKELYFIRFERSLMENTSNNVLPLKTINHGAVQSHRAFIVENNLSIKLYSYNNLILEYRLNKTNNNLYVATNTISTPNSPYDLKGSYSTSTNYNSFDKNNNSINLTLLLSVTTTQHINAFLLHIPELNDFKKSNKGATAFIRSLTDKLTLQQFKKLQKTNDKNKLVKLASYNKKEGRWSFEQYKE